ncbi:MAG: long-chain-fatty-acid--CoA ligase [Mycobacterium sp.]
MYLTQSLHRAVQQSPEAIATICGERVRTFASSADRIARLAGGLRQLGVQQGDRVGILALNSDRYHEYLYAVPWLGAVLNPVNIRWSATEIIYSLRDSDTTVLLVDDTHAAMIAPIRAGFPELRTIIYIGDGQPPPNTVSYEQLLATADPIADSRTGGSELLGIFYTGGTTGTPKGVMLSHQNLLTSALGALASGQYISTRGRLLHVAPMFHLAGIAAWTAGNLVGSAHIFQPRFVPSEALHAIQAYRITDIILVPTMIQMLIDEPDVDTYQLDTLRCLAYGASVISEAVLERARTVFPSAAFTQAYGMTELAPVATILLPEDHDDTVLRRAAGRAAPHTEVRIVNDDGTEVPRGSVGEVAVRGNNVMLGYWNRPEDTAAAVRDGWMHTGDGGYMDDAGYVFIVDRIKDMIITGGENVYSAEVENAIAQHQAVASVAVIGVPDERWGESVHAVVVLRAGRHADEGELRDHCRNLIAGYKVPSTIAFTDVLPMSAAGKILKRQLREQLTTA